MKIKLQLILVFAILISCSKNKTSDPSPSVDVLPNALIPQNNTKAFGSYSGISLNKDGTFFYRLAVRNTNSDGNIYVGSYQQLKQKLVGEGNIKDASEVLNYKFSYYGLSFSVSANGDNPTCIYPQSGFYNYSITTCVKEYTDAMPSHYYGTMTVSLNGDGSIFSTYPSCMSIDKNLKASGGYILQSSGTRYSFNSDPVSPNNYLLYLHNNALLYVKLEGNTVKGSWVANPMAYNDYRYTVNLTKVNIN